MKEEDEFEVWFTELWWLYPNDLSHKKKGSKLKAKQAALKIYKDKKGGMVELNRIIDNTRALIRNDKKEWDRGGKPDRWPHVSSYINGGYYDREIECESDRQQQAAQTLCQCGKPTVVQSKCVDCYDKGNPAAQASTQRLRESWLRVKAKVPMLEGESNTQYARRAYKRLGGPSL